MNSNCNKKSAHFLKTSTQTNEACFVYDIDAQTLFNYEMYKHIQKVDMLQRP